MVRGNEVRKDPRLKNAVQSSHLAGTRGIVAKRPSGVLGLQVRDRAFWLYWTANVTITV